MSTHIQLFLLAYAALAGACTNSEHEPEVTVGDSDHLLVNWTNAFKDCDSTEVQSIVVEMGSSGFTLKTIRVIDATFDAKQAKVKTNPCLGYSEIKIRLKYNKSDVWSLPSSYNNYHSYNIKIEGLYSGLLQNKVVDQICIKKGGVPSIPAIPEELSKCVSFHESSKKPNANGLEFSFEIVNPLYKDGRTTRVKTQISKKCSRWNIMIQDVIDNNKAKSKEANNSEKQVKGNKWMIGITIGTSILVIAIVITVVIACRICSKKKQENELAARADVNPEYDGGVDYVYDDMGNYESTEVSTTRRREVTAELVDRSSIYGEKEEGWENAVAVDANSYYGD